MNSDIVIIVLVSLLGLAVGVLILGAYLNKNKMSEAFEKAQADSQKILEGARREADSLIKSSLKEAKDEARKRRKQFEEESKRKRGEYQKLEQKTRQREQALEQRIDQINSRERSMEEKEKKLYHEEKKYLRKIAECEINIEKTQKTLEKIANMSADEAKRELMASLEEQAKKDAQQVIRQIELDTKKEASKKAQSIISLAVQRLSGEYVNDSTISVVSLPNEEMKGRIIGREGRNIRAIEQSTGVDLIIDDTPEAVIISCFNPIRREIAKITLERLIADGRIHPARIEETAERVTEEFDQILTDHGEQAAFDVAITDLHPEMLNYLGKLKYKTTGLQSVLQHAVETAHICGMIASELGINVKRAKRAGLLHDIGKAVDQEAEGHHATLGAQLCEKYGEHADIVEAIKLHHEEDLTMANPLTICVNAANALSGARPGARKEVLETYIKRLVDMEEIVKDFEGIEEAFVLQAGREVRALVSPGGLNDEEIIDISNNIVSKLRNELTFPGQVRISVLRESKYIDYAK